MGAAAIANPRDFPSRNKNAVACKDNLERFIELLS